MAIAPALKSIAKAILPSNTVEYLKRMMPSGDNWPPVPFDNLYPWLNYTFSGLLKKEMLARRNPQSRRANFVSTVAVIFMHALRSTERAGGPEASRRITANAYNGRLFRIVRVGLIDADGRDRGNERGGFIAVVPAEPRQRVGFSSVRELRRVKRESVGLRCSRFKSLLTK